MTRGARCSAGRGCGFGVPGRAMGLILCLAAVISRPSISDAGQGRLPLARRATTRGQAAGKAQSRGLPAAVAPSASISSPASVALACPASPATAAKNYPSAASPRPLLSHFSFSLSRLSASPPEPNLNLIGLELDAQILFSLVCRLLLPFHLYTFSP